MQLKKNDKILIEFLNNLNYYYNLISFEDILLYFYHKFKNKKYRRQCIKYFALCQAIKELDNEIKKIDYDFDIELI